MTEKEYKKLLDGLFSGLLLAQGENSSEIKTMAPLKKQSRTNPFDSTIGVNSGPVINGLLENKKSAPVELPSSLDDLTNAISMVSSSGGNSKTNPETKWIFIANPNCCPKCLEMNGQIEIGPEEPKYYGHVHDREGRFNCRCHWVRMQ